MVIFPHAKINLGLNVIRRREDGFHDIESVLVPIPLHDVLEAVVAPELEEGQVHFTRTGLPVPGDPDQDLCWKALDLIKKERRVPGIRLHLHKVIPMGAGLGGGSSDATHVLLLMNDLFSLGFDRNELVRLASELGSDCPFFLERRIQSVSGRGEKAEPMDLILSGWWLLLINPGETIGTAEVYKECVPTDLGMDLRRILKNEPVRMWQDQVRNDLEPYVLRTRPRVFQALSSIQRSGAAYASMSGSGSTVYGLYDRRPPLLKLPEGGAKSWVFEL